jgi:hypothetical protein
VRREGLAEYVLDLLQVAEDVVVVRAADGCRRKTVLVNRAVEGRTVTRAATTDRRAGETADI